MRVRHALVCGFLILTAPVWRTVSIAQTVRPISPIRVVEVLLGKEERTKFLDGLNAIANDLAFAIHTGYPKPPFKEFVTIQMFREDLWVIVINPEDIDHFVVSIYKRDQSEPDSYAHAGAEQFQSALVNITRSLSNANVSIHN